VCHVEESATSASPLCHQGANALNTDYSFNYGQNFTNFFCRFILRVHVISHAFLFDLFFSA
jgi:hypothetical protein